MTRSKALHSALGSESHTYCCGGFFPPAGGTGSGGEGELGVADFFRRRFSFPPLRPLPFLLPPFAVFAPVRLRFFSRLFLFLFRFFGGSCRSGTKLMLSEPVHVHNVAIVFLIFCTYFIFHLLDIFQLSCSTSLPSLSSLHFLVSSYVASPVNPGVVHPG